MPDHTSSYDAIPYPSVPFPESHPDRLSAIARLFGLRAPDPRNARVLELGCSMGGNLVAIAQNHPASRCLGIDASSRQIADGWKTVEALGLRNVQLRHLDILEVDDEFGEFDYIICHGVFSWVPVRVQNKLLEICQRHLARNGVAYISYNTYPGWHIRGIVRDMMFYRGMQFGDAATRLAQAKSLVEFVARSSQSSDTPYQRLLQAEFRQLGRMTDHYLHHEYLEEHNQPLYFHEFAKKLAVNGLQYLGEADFSTMISTNFSPEVARMLQELGAHDILQMEQYMDFVRCRYFRKTLLCQNGIKLNRTIDASIVKELLLGSNPTIEDGNAALGSTEPVTFQSSAGGRLTCRSPLTKAALLALQRAWPMPIGFAELLEQATAAALQLGHVAGTGAADFLAAELLTGIGAGVVEWRVTPVAYTSAPGNRPCTSPLARLQATQGYKATNFRGETVSLDEIHRQTLSRLDGSRSLSQLVEDLVIGVKDGKFILRPEDEPRTVTEGPEIRTLITTALDKVLINLGKQAFLDARST